MKRSKAANLIDDLRQLDAKHRFHDVKDEGALGLRAILESFDLTPLEPCDGESHSNAHIDNCSRCAPRWGFVGPKEPVT